MALDSRRREVDTGPMTGLITGSRVRLRPAAAPDAARFEEILSHPQVARWWADAEEPVAAQVSYLLDHDLRHRTR
jgi:aminoglycoside 6'-N-acetyltransferase